MAHIWGWATWRSAWQRYDRHLENWPEIKRTELLLEIFGNVQLAAHWTRIFDLMHADIGPNTWDYQWVYTNLVNNALSVAPRVNLVENIGFGAEGTHTTVKQPALAITAKPLEFPLTHPVAMMPSQRLDRRDQLLSLSAPLPVRAIKRLWASRGRS
jgi:hypothetical protein